MQEATIKFRDKERLMLTTVDANYFFWYCKSLNGRYVIAFNSDEVVPSIGNYFLLKDNAVACYGTLVRPHDGKVGDNGTFIINDWLDSESKAGKFYALDETGREKLVVSTKSNLHINAISTSGRFALFSTFNSNIESWNNKVFLYDLQGEPTLLWNKHGAPIWPDEYILKDNISVTVRFRKREAVVLDWNGNIPGTRNGFEGIGWVREN